MIAQEAIMHLEDSLVITNLVSKDKTADFMVRPNGYRVGDTVRIKTRPEYTVDDFTGEGPVNVQTIRESTRTMSIEHLYDVTVEVTAREKALDLESFSEQVIQPAVYKLAEQVDIYVGTKILEARGMYASDDLFADAADMAQARKTATEQQLNTIGRICLTDLDLEARLLGAAYFSTWNQRGPSGTTVFDNASMGHAMGMDFFSSINFPTETPYSAGAGVGVTNNTGGTLNLVGMTAITTTSTTATFEAGDRIYIAGVRRPLIVLTQTVATATSIPLAHPIDEIIPDGAAITVVASGLGPLNSMGAIFDTDALAVAMPILDMASDKPTSVVSNNGVSIRIVQGYDMQRKVDTLSLDLLVGAAMYDGRRVVLLDEY